MARSQLNPNAGHGESPLCLCEYYNRRNKRVHILMCCCACDALDAIVTNICCCRDRNADRYAALIDLVDDVLDRVRIPYIGGAFKINVDFILSLFCLIFYLAIGQLSLFSTFFVVLTVPTVLYLRFFFHRLSQKPIRLPFYTIANSFLLILYIFFTKFQFEFETFLNPNQIIFYKILLVVNIAGLYTVHTSNPGYVMASMQWPTSTLSQSRYCNHCKLYKLQFTSHCPICAHCIQRRDHHCFWFDNCIGQANHRIFYSYLVYLNFYFSYSFYMVVTNRNMIYKIQSFNLLRLLFIQLMSLTVYLLVLLGQQTLFICLNRTQYEIHKLSEHDRRFSLIKYVVQSFSIKSFVLNFCNFLFSSRSTHNLNVYSV